MATSKDQIDRTSSPDGVMSLIESNDDNEMAREPTASASNANSLADDPRFTSRNESWDLELAQYLQDQENQQTMTKAVGTADPEKERLAMTQSPEGKAILAVQSIISLANSVNEKYTQFKEHCIETITMDDMVHFATNMLHCQQDFLSKGIPSYIDVGFHYTNSSNLEHIRQNGLLSKADRSARNISSVGQHGSTFGDGIYTANDPAAFARYGDTGLIVGRLQGKVLRVLGFLCCNGNGIDKEGANTIIGVKRGGIRSGEWPVDDRRKEIVLQSSLQCLPMIKFDRALTHSTEGLECIKFMQKSLTKIMDDFFNDGVDQRTDTSFPMREATTADKEQLQKLRWQARMARHQRRSCSNAPIQPQCHSNASSTKRESERLNAAKLWRECVDARMRSTSSTISNIHDSSTAAVAPLTTTTSESKRQRGEDWLKEFAKKRRELNPDDSSTMAVAQLSPACAQKTGESRGMQKLDQTKAAIDEPELKAREALRQGYMNHLISSLPEACKGESILSSSGENFRQDFIALLRASTGVEEQSSQAMQLSSMTKEAIKRDSLEISISQEFLDSLRHAYHHASLGHSISATIQSGAKDEITSKPESASSTFRPPPPPHFDILEFDQNEKKRQNCNQNNPTPPQEIPKGNLNSKATAFSRLPTSSAPIAQTRGLHRTLPAWLTKQEGVLVFGDGIKFPSSLPRDTKLPSWMKTHASIDCPHGGNCMHLTPAIYPKISVASNGNLKSPPEASLAKKTEATSAATNKGGDPTTKSMMGYNARLTFADQVSNNQTMNSPFHPMRPKQIPIEHIIPSSFDGGGSPHCDEIIEYEAPSTMATGILPDAKTTPPSSYNLDEDCAVCLDSLKNDRCTALSVCGHVFHDSCCDEAFNLKAVCPICRKSVGNVQGTSPSGSMTVSTTSIKCAGFREGSILIKYSMPAGIQMSYHDNPGMRHSSKHARAYLPNNHEGREVLKRLKFAFMHGLTFTVGVSITTGAKNQCTWASIHHKTHTSGGVKRHGFPDPSYFHNVNKELDSLGVPNAEDLDEAGEESKFSEVVLCLRQDIELQ